MLGGKIKGWLPDIAVIMWRRMLGALGDPNEVKNPQIHAAMFDYLVELGSVLIKVSHNLLYRHHQDDLIHAIYYHCCSVTFPSSVHEC